MKAGALILSFLFIVLTVQPVFIKWNCASTGTGHIDKIKPGKTVTKQAGCKKSCSAAKEHPLKKPAEQQSEDPCNTCNPFMACNACPYVAEETEQVFPPSVLVETDNTEGPNDFIFSDYNADCWHPPELFSIL